MLYTLIIFLLMNSLLILFSKTPILMLMFLIIQTLLITLMSNFFNLSSWYAYILFLILIGGLLILFIYINSLIPNQKIKFNTPIWFLEYSLVIIMLILNTFLYQYYNTIESMNFMNLEIETNFFIKLMMNKLYNKPTNFIMFMLINYLLVTLMISVKIININLGPIRKK